VFDAYFDVLDERGDGGRYLADPATAGPWNAGLQHGGPPSALLVRAAERLAAVAAERSDLVAVRLAAEFVGPVPVGEVTVEARVVRAARSAVLVDAVLSAGARPCLQARVWLVRRLDTTALARPLPPRRPAPDEPTGLGTQFPYGDSIEWQAVSGSMVTPGPGVMWARAPQPLVVAETLSGLQRVALIGDTASGISSELDWDVWSFVNVDLDVHLARPVDGEWLLLDATTTLGTHGTAMARSTVSDLRGEVGCTAQTLVLSPR
jgi:hypothetical protein